MGYPDAIKGSRQKSVPAVYISLHWRLMLVTMTSSAVGMIVAMTLLFIYNDRRIREDKIEELRSAADLIGTNTSPP